MRQDLAFLCVRVSYCDSVKFCGRNINSGVGNELS